MKRISALILSLLSAAALLTGCGEKPAALRPAALGTVADSHYENAYVNFQADFDEDWEILDASQLQEMTQEIQDQLNSTEAGETLSAHPQITDLNAMDTKHGTSVNVLYTELTRNELDAYAAMTEEAVVDSVLAMGDQAKEAYEALGMEILSMEKVTVNFMGRERCAIRTEARTRGMGILMIQIFDYQLGGRYGVTTTFSGLYESMVEDCMTRFSPLPAA